MLQSNSFICTKKYDKRLALGNEMASACVFSTFYTTSSSSTFCLFLLFFFFFFFSTNVGRKGMYFVQDHFLSLYVRHGISYSASGFLRSPPLSSPGSGSSYRFATSSLHFSKPLTLSEPKRLMIVFKKKLRKKNMESKLRWLIQGGVVPETGPLPDHISVEFPSFSISFRQGFSHKTG